MLSPKLHLVKRSNFFENKENNPNLRSSNFMSTTMFGPDAISEFKKSIEAEKNLIKEIKNSRSVDKNLRNYEKSYKLQVQNLLEENNQLKIDIALLKKQTKKSMGGEDGKKSKEEKTIEDYKLLVLSKDSLIKELEFQINELSSENRLLKIVNDTQTKTIDQLEQDLVKHRDLEQIIEESNEEIVKLRSMLHDEDNKQDTLKNQINALQAELLSQRSRIHGNSLNNTIADLTGIGDSLYLYSFLEDPNEKNKDFDQIQGNLRRKLKKALSHDMKRFNSQKILPINKYEEINTENNNDCKMICLENKKELLPISEEPKTQIYQRKLGKENENFKAQMEVRKYKLEQLKHKNDKLLTFLNEHNCS